MEMKKWEHWLTKGIHWKVLFYWFPPLSGFSWRRWESTPRRTRSGNEADTEPEEDECLWKINPLVRSIGKLSSDTTANVEGEWFNSKDLDLAYFSIFVSDSVTSDTSTDVDSDPWSAMNALTSLHAATKSSLMVCEKIESAFDALFELPTRQKGQKLILFGRIETEPVAYENSGGNFESS